jgi:LysR family glycine cleavage system transcriptional activator
MRYRLPPLTTLEGFDAAARLGSFSAAAEELGLSQSAVSHQIRNLERALDQELFSRTFRQVALTDAGREFHRTVREMLHQLRRGVERLAPYRKPNSVVIYCDPAFARLWLMPRLPALMAALPEVDLWLDSRGHDIDFDTTEFDIFITMEPDSEPVDFPQKLLFPVYYRPYASREIADRIASLDNVPEDLFPPLLHLEGAVDWSGWFDAETNGRGPLASWLSSGPTFSDPLLLLEAAAQGLGVALAPEIFAAGTVLDGKIAAIGKRRLESNSPYRLLVNCQPEDAIYVEPTVEWICAAARG